MIRFLLFLVAISSVLPSLSQDQKGVSLVNVDSGWARNSVNTVIFRKNSLVSFMDTQYIAFYDKESFVVLGKRSVGSSAWQLKKTGYRGNTSDAHNCISIMTDGEGYLHMAWDHHGNRLNYVKSVAPGSLELTDRLPMTGLYENQVTYPEFHKLKDGGLVFLYRDGSSGKGNLVLNRYDITTRKWIQVQSNLVDGEGQRNAYWQACIDKAGTIHLSWVWRESPDVASNHDMCYARSPDGGRTWEKSNGEKYVLPVTAATAEYIARIPQNSELINQTSMCTDLEGHPVIASYWRDAGSMVPQYHIIYRENNGWQVRNTGFRKTDFSLSGAGTKRIPISRPQVLSFQKKKGVWTVVLFRDEERGNKVSAAFNKNIRKHNRWKIIDLADAAVGSWEPTYDIELWKGQQVAHLFVQQVQQADGEGLISSGPSMVQVLEWKPAKRSKK